MTGCLVLQRSLRQRLGQPMASNVKDRLTLTVPTRGGRGSPRTRGRGRSGGRGRGGRLSECFVLLPVVAQWFCSHEMLENLVILKPVGN
jgi:hypothetical protein